MSFLSSLFSRNDRFKSVSEKLSIEEVSEDPCSFEQLSLRNLDRSKFNHQDLQRLGWWPDQLLKMIQVNQIAYIDVMHLHGKYSSSFDQPLRDFIKWLEGQSFDQDHDLCQKKESFFEFESTKIETRYWDRVLKEDNCYMYQLEDFSAERSDQENKHYKLFSLTKKCLFEKRYSNEYLRIYVSLYDLRGAHARIDDLFRKALYTFLTDPTFTFELRDLVKGLSNEIDELIQLCKNVDDDDILEKLTVFSRLMKYMYISVQMFNDIMFGSLETYAMESNFCDNISSLRKTYQYFINRIRRKTFQDSLILKGSSVGTIMGMRNLPQKESFTIHSDRPVTPRRINRRRSRSFNGTKK